MDGHQTNADDDGDNKSIVRIERLNRTKETKGTRYLNELVSQQPTKNDGAIDWKAVIDTPVSTVHNEMATMKSALIKHGRYARYSTDVDEPTTEIVGTYKNKGGYRHEDVYNVIVDHVDATDDGRVDIDVIKDYTDRNGEPFTTDSIVRTLAEHVRVVLPMEWDESIEHDSTETTSTVRSEPTVPRNIYANVLGMEPTDIPDDPVEAFELGLSSGIDVGEQKAQLNEL